MKTGASISTDPRRSANFLSSVRACAELTRLARPVTTARGQYGASIALRGSATIRSQEGNATPWRGLTTQRRTASRNPYSASSPSATASLGRSGHGLRGGRVYQRRRRSAQQPADRPQELIAVDRFEEDLRGAERLRGRQVALRDRAGSERDDAQTGLDAVHLGDE